MGTLEDYISFIRFWWSQTEGESEDRPTLADMMKHDAASGHIRLKGEEMSNRLRQIVPPEFSESIDRYNAFWEALENDPGFTGAISFTGGNLVIYFWDTKDKNSRPTIDSFPVDYDRLDFYRPTSHHNNALQFYKLWRYARKRQLQSVPVLFEYWEPDDEDPDES